MVIALLKGYRLHVISVLTAPLFMNSLGFSTPRPSQLARASMSQSFLQNEFITREAWRPLAMATFGKRDSKSTMRAVPKKAGYQQRPARGAAFVFVFVEVRHQRTGRR